MAEIIPFDQFGGLLFDLDGTLADSMELHNNAWIATLGDLGCKMTSEILEEYAGVPNQKTVEIFNKRFGWKLDPNSVAVEKEARFINSIDQVIPIEPVLQIARKYQNKKAMAIVSGGSRMLVGRILAALKIENLFPVRVCAEDVVNGKPHPDPFLHAARLLNVSPEKCLVFEDGEAGIQGAKSARMGVVRVARDFALEFLS